MYVISHLQRRLPDALKLEEDLPHVEAASKISLPTLTGDLGTLTKEFESVSNSIEAIKSTKSDKFQAKMKKFIKSAKEDIEMMNKKFQSAMENFEKLLEFFGEEAKKTTPEEFFGIIFNFINQFKVLTKKKENEERKNK
jgi:hypothetical protein